jgi:drug/metabolite transporter (DMT)-like permease
MFMVISQIAFMANDTLVKIVTSEIGIGQIMAVRGMFASAMIVYLVWQFGLTRGPAVAMHPMILLRVVGELGGTVFYLLALAHLPIANVSAVFQSLPLVVTMSAALFLGEKVGPRRWLAITVGFVGILMIVRPGLEGFSTYSLFVIASVASCALRDLATRHVPHEVPSMYISMLTAIAVTICGGLVAPFTGGWQPLTPTVLGTLFLSAVLVLTGYQFIIKSTRIGDISFVAPFRYTNLLWAIASGILVFGEMPDFVTAIGASLVVGSGIYSLYRERVVGRNRIIAESTGPTTAPDGV